MCTNNLSQLLLVFLQVLISIDTLIVKFRQSLVLVHYYCNGAFVYFLFIYNTFLQEYYFFSNITLRLVDTRLMVISVTL